jgi:hypothetical protein
MGFQFIGAHFREAFGPRVGGPDPIADFSFSLR